MPPLYFQHQGHSRTIVGVEIMKSDGGGGVRLLVFDPSNSKMANFLAGGDGIIQDFIQNQFEWDGNNPIENKKRCLTAKILDT